MSEFRLVRLGEQIRNEISQMILKQQIKDPRVSTFLNINRVEVSRDLSYAKVYVSSFMDDKKTEKGIKGLESAAGFIQTTLSRKLSLRQFPKLQFVADSSIKDGFEMVHKLAEITASDAAVSAVIDKDVETE
ncbi:MAG: 30S ribosome-binding factor RbfA [Treponema sp.]|jgi:ribosome-binding factor A|nr:30S ribosome-binding factor RbfA [Treponema sp.]